MSAQYKFFWYKSGSFVLAVDAIGTQDARNYVKAWHPGRKFEYLGHYACPSTTSACNGVTTARQAIISDNLNKFMGW